MLIKQLKLRMFLVLVSLFLLCQCAKTVNSTEPVVTVNKKLKTPYSLPTAAYLAMAKSQQGHEKQSALISAAGRLITDGQWKQGTAILAQTGELTVEQANEKNLLLAKVDFMRDRPRDALAKLARIKEPERLSLYNQIQFHEQLAKSFRSIGSYSESVSERIKLESLLPDEESQVNNRRALWLTLTSLPQEELNTMALEAVNKSEMQGWLQLAVISRKYRNNSKSLLAALDQWQMHFSNHPANEILPNPLDSISGKLLAPPKQVALLLPLSGSLSGPGNAIREGFMAAYKANRGDESTKIKVYDTSKGDITNTYRQAISDGAEYVVGPLTKTQVATIASMEHPVPTLLLNDTDASTQNNSYSLGLSPVNEAIQVAIKARSKGYKKALIIAPNNAWGNEVTKAFISQWNEDGGHIVDSLRYEAKQDLNKSMKDFLQITNSQEREKKLKQVLGYNFQSTTSRRQDFDMIFLLAYPSKARQIMPLLKYYYAGDVPVYATSSVYGGSANALKDKDLDGIIFCDMPWVFSHQMGTKNWPEQFNSYNRLYALGVDSYTLATQLNQLILFPADGSNDSTGILYLKPTQQVARVLEWGQFKQGLAHSLGDTV
ncbi:Penicillin-binding protein activator LpoA precursor [Legionella pneumophila]|uniref:Lipoprotein n=1 Tax=Legionella pneumophila subsp. pneumophila TaxID=91891 RepID=A0AAV2V1N3_LEGPN|nr:penicillin-binding protein activator [Legionella pneumophila]MCK1850784.1 penicillin-binding protein activator [Legionella pneumophila]MDI9853360.1 penicillin-binding protein activator [Legionella pneumophila]MDW8868319.1 penicillin-binding protein activator [Legionella pneumophila]MDW8969942.1 penicillin-binding protein activator [Legionella pneumophila]MDW9137971.1 penicillin-binding protein activator [Legionella pneumophila]